MLTVNKRPYNIAGICLSVQGLLLDEDWKNFESRSHKGQTDVSIEALSKPIERYNLESVQLKEKETYCFRHGSEVMLVDKEWRNVRILPPVDMESVSAFLVQIFHTQAVKKRMIQIHSSMIDYQNRGVLFLGPSGIGKTTMAELWYQYRNALIINGDMNFVQETERGFLGWGTPWHGSSPYCENRNVQVCALVVLKQSVQNSIRRLEGFEMVQTVSDNIIYPTWLENGMELCLETLDHLLSRLPVYELSCRPDEEAVKLTEETIFGGGSVSD